MNVDIARVLIGSLMASTPSVSRAFPNLPEVKAPPSAEEIAESMRRIEQAKLKRERKALIRATQLRNKP